TLPHRDAAARASGLGAARTPFERTDEPSCGTSPPRRSPTGTGREPKPLFVVTDHDGRHKPGGRGPTVHTPSAAVSRRVLDAEDLRRLPGVSDTSNRSSG